MKIFIIIKILIFFVDIVSPFNRFASDKYKFIRKLTTDLRKIFKQSNRYVRIHRHEGYTKFYLYKNHCIFFIGINIIYTL